jgi:hypothetical protein
MDLDHLDVRPKSQQGVWMDLLDPAGKVTKVRLLVRGTDCSAYNDKLKEQVRRGVERAGAQGDRGGEDAEFWELHATLVADWKGLARAARRLPTRPPRRRASRGLRLDLRAGAALRRQARKFFAGILEQLIAYVAPRAQARLAAAGRQAAARAPAGGRRASRRSRAPSSRVPSCRSSSPTSGAGSSICAPRAIGPNGMQPIPYAGDPRLVGADRQPPAALGGRPLRDLDMVWLDDPKARRPWRCRSRSSTPCGSSSGSGALSRGNAFRPACGP